MLSIIYNRKDSFKDFGLVVIGTITRPSINPIYETYNIPGRRGSLNSFQYYNDNEISINFGFKTFENITSRKSRILEWLNSNTLKELIISDDKSIFYKVNKVSVSGFDGKNIKTFSCTFIVDPFVKLQEGNESIEIIKPTTIYNGKANEKSEPYFKIYGNGDLTIYINSQTLVLKNIEEFVEVDSQLLNCYKTINGSVVNMNNRMYSEFPLLDVGENNISWKGNVAKIEMKPRWCCL